MVMVETELDSGLHAEAGGSIMEFYKMQGLGNDFVVTGENELKTALNALCLKASEEALLPQLARILCRRNFSVGADGFIVVKKGSKTDRLSWTYLNSDGSSSVMCGNGLRCLALWAELKGVSPSRKYLVETGKGPVEIQFDSQDKITSDLGEPIFEAEAIPLSRGGKEHFIGRELRLRSGESLRVSCLSMGNPHCVVFSEQEFNEESLSELAAEIQSNELFPEGVNVEFVQILSRDCLKVIVYERGCGRTLACASGAAAAVVAAALEKTADRKATVKLEGGELQISWQESDNHVRISGPAELSFQGQIDLKTLKLEDLQW